jgi:hypothetical protein
MSTVTYVASPVQDTRSEQKVSLHSELALAWRFLPRALALALAKALALALWATLAP